MKVINIHSRELETSIKEAGRLIDNLASANDLLWPHDRWIKMKLNRPLSVGASGGHGPIGYFVIAYQPGQLVEFRFTNPTGFKGTHRFELDKINDDRVKLIHTIDMVVEGKDLVAWSLAVRPLHDALMEDALDRAEIFSGGNPKPRSWSMWVRFLRWALKPKK
jgi:hypothetical protein